MEKANKETDHHPMSAHTPIQNSKAVELALSVLVFEARLRTTQGGYKWAVDELEGGESWVIRVQREK